MIVGLDFQGDTCDSVKRMQHDEYGRVLGLLFSLARDQFVAAHRDENPPPPELAPIRAMRDFDHRTLQWTHDRIAARFRFTHEPKLPLQDQWGFNLGAIRQHWFSFAREEIARLVAKPGFSQAVVTAAFWENKPSGYQAEDFLYSFLKSEYSDMPWINYSAVSPAS